MPAVALTDQSNLFAMVKFYKEAQSAGVKPLIGVDAWIRETGERAPPSRIVLLCQDLVGYRHLTQLVTRSYLEGQQRGVPMFERAWLDEETLSGLVVLSGGPEGDIGRAIARGRACRRGGALPRRLARSVRRSILPRGAAHRPGRRAGVHRGRARFGGLARRRGARDQRRAVSRARRFRGARGARLHPRRRAARRSQPPRRYSEEQYLKSPAEMAELFADAPELLANTVEVARAVRSKSSSAPRCCRPIRCRPAARPSNSCAMNRRAALRDRLAGSLAECAGARRARL
jgi:DNA polymerase III subunit alpha